MLRVKLAYLDRDTARRQQIAAMYCEGINNPHIVLPIDAAAFATQHSPLTIQHYLSHVWHLFVVRTEQREVLQQWLTKHEIQTLIHYPIPPHQQQAYAQWNSQSKPLTEMVHQQVISLPLDPTMSDEQVQQVITVMNGFKA